MLVVHHFLLSLSYTNEIETLRLVVCIECYLYIIKLFFINENFLTKNREAYYRLAFSYVRNKENALDIVQDSTFKVLNVVDRLEISAYMKTWFYRIIVNTSIEAVAVATLFTGSLNISPWYIFLYSEQFCNDLP